LYSVLRTALCDQYPLSGFTVEPLYKAMLGTNLAFAESLAVFGGYFLL